MATRILQLLVLRNRNYWKCFHTTPKTSAFFERDEKAGYPRKSDYVPPKLTTFGQIREGYKHLKEELKVLKEEIKDNLRMDPIIVYPQGQVDVKFKFDGDPKTLEKWIVSCDSDWNEGKSKAKLELTPNGTGLFTGIIDTTIIKDGRNRQSGYANISTTKPIKSFKRMTVHDWSMYTHLILRIRGDGRNYMLNLQTKNFYDIMWNDLHHFVMYTRGGPYWQYVRIPFSKFFLSNRGRIQDIQGPVRKDEIESIGITASDGIPGPFSLEIDFIGVERDESYKEKFAYELYVPPHPFYI